MARWAMPYSQSTLGIAPAIAALADQAHIDAEQARNTEVRKFTTRFFRDADKDTCAPRKTRMKFFPGGQAFAS